MTWARDASVTLLDRGRKLRPLLCDCYPVSTKPRFPVVSSIVNLVIAVCFDRYT